VQRQTEGKSIKDDKLKTSMRIVFACNLFLVKYEITTNNKLLIIRTEHRREYQSHSMYLASQISL